MIAREFTGRGWTAEQYDELIAGMQLGGRAADGVVFHWAGVTSDGIRVVDVYESREAADRLAAEKIGPLAQALGLAPPEVAEYDVHATLAR